MAPPTVDGRRYSITNNTEADIAYLDSCKETSHTGRWLEAGAEDASLRSIASLMDRGGS